MSDQKPKTPPTYKPPSALGQWVRYRSWKWLVGLFLILMGVMNIYPFIWMMGTSLKSTPEAARHREDPLPSQKYFLTPAGTDAVPMTLPESALKLLSDLQTRAHLADQAETPQPTPRTWAQRHGSLVSATEAEAQATIDQLIDQGRLVSAPPYREYGLTEKGLTGSLDELTEAQAAVIENLRDAAEPDAPPPTITDDRFASTLGIDLVAAERQLSDLVAAGLLRAKKPLPAVQLSEAAQGELLDGLNARQLLALSTLKAGDASRREQKDTFVHVRLTSAEYADLVGLDAEDPVVTSELSEMMDASLLDASPFLWQNYLVVFKDMKFYVNFITSLIVTIAVVFIVVYTTAMLGYAIARLKFPGKMWVLMLILLGAVAPREAVIIPIFRTLQGADLLEGLWGMVLWLGGVGIGNSLLMAGFFLTLPGEVEEAATVDGAGPFRTFFDIAMPMARPIVVTVGLFAFLSAWNNFLIPFICTQAEPNMQPLAVAVYSFQQGRTGFWGLTNAAAAIMIIPVIVIFLLTQRHIVKSIAVGAVKG